MAKYKLFLIKYEKLGFNYESIWAKNEKGALKIFKAIHPYERVKEIAVLKNYENRN